MLSGLPPLARAGDRFDAGFTLRNTTTRAMSVKATLTGRADGKAQSMQLEPQTVQLAAGAALELRWPVSIGAEHHARRVGSQRRGAKRRQTRARPPEDRAGGGARGAAARLAGDAAAAGRQGVDADGATGRCAARLGPRRCGAAAQPGRRAAGPAPLLRDLSLQLPGAEDLARHRAARRTGLGAAARRSRGLPRQRRPGRLLSQHTRQRRARQRPPQRLPDHQRTRSRLAVARGHAGGDAARADGLCRRPHRAPLQRTARRPGRAQARRARSAGAPRPRAAAHAGQRGLDTRGLADIALLDAWSLYRRVDNAARARRTGSTNCSASSAAAWSPAAPR